MAGKALGPWSGVYHPDYDIRIYKNGNPGNPLTGVDLRSVTQITTDKNIDDISGTFEITLKDRRAQSKVDPMDVVTIRLKGHNQGWGKVLVGVVDTIEPTGDAEPTTSEADMTISGRCTGKYLQINSMFLPAWDPSANLPTALIFGLGAVADGLGNNISNKIYPRTIFGYVFDRFVVGKRNVVGESGTPNARFWMNRRSRFQWVRAAGGKIFQVPFIQFDEDTCDTALTNLVIQGFTEGWVDEVGNIVYRRPQWDAPVAWNLSTAGLKDWDLPKSDDTLATYVEVFPGAYPGISAGVSQAMLSGRAPIPSDYITGLQDSGFSSVASRPFIIDTDGTGKVTAKGAKNWYYQKQKQYGVRPYQITSALLADRDQAQAQAEGLLRFMLRFDKSGTITIPGEPGVRLGTSIYLKGPLDDQVLARTYYIEGVHHEYIEGESYQTTLTLTHGRDPGDPSWQQMVLPNASAATIAEYGGVLNTSSGATASGSSYSLSDASFTIPTNLSDVRASILAATDQALQMPADDWTYSEIGRPQPAAVSSWDSLSKPIKTDCSGFATLCYKIAGAPDPNGAGYSGAGYSGAMEQTGTRTSSPQPGDLAFWSGNNVTTFDHVAVYVGNGQIVEHGSQPVTLSTVTAETATGMHSAFVGYRTYLSGPGTSSI
jgi:cell wall-associated NlpC family hydrolase